MRKVLPGIKFPGSFFSGISEKLGLFSRQMIFFVSFFIVLIALLTSLTLYRQGPSDLYLRLFPIYLAIIAILVGLSDWFAFWGIHNLYLLNPLTIFQNCFYFFVLYRIIRQPVVKNIAFHLIWIYPVVAATNILFIQKKIDTFHTITYSLGGLLVVGLSVFYFFELFQRPQSVNLARNPDFWVCSGLLFYFACSFPIIGMTNNLNSMPRFILNNLYTILNVLDFLLYISFSIAFLCRLRIRKSS
jgi:hypothetical protein